MSQFCPGVRLDEAGNKPIEMGFGRGQATQVTENKHALFPAIPLKIWWERSRVGSIPTLGTKLLSWAMRRRLIRSSTCEVWQFSALDVARSFSKSPDYFLVFTGTNLAQGDDIALIEDQRPSMGRRASETNKMPPAHSSARSQSNQRRHAPHQMMFPLCRMPLHSPIHLRADRALRRAMIAIRLQSHPHLG